MLFVLCVYIGVCMCTHTRLCTVAVFSLCMCIYFCECRKYGIFLQMCFKFACMSSYVAMGLFISVGFHVR